MNKNILILGALFGMLTVVIGAFGAHALKGILEANGRLNVFETAVRYQFYHAIALIVSGILSEKFSYLWISRAAYLFTAGIIVFSGSLYALSITNIGVLGAITPVGGVMLILGWASLIVGIIKQKH